MKLTWTARCEGDPVHINDGCVGWLLAQVQKLPVVPQAQEVVVRVGVHELEFLSGEPGHWDLVCVLHMNDVQRTANADEATSCFNRGQLSEYLCFHVLLTVHAAGTVDVLQLVHVVGEEVEHRLPAAVGHSVPERQGQELACDGQIY